jgi:hypothetical protein
MGARPGEESRPTALRLSPIEAQPFFGQIKPSKRSRGLLLNHNSGRRHGKYRLSCASLLNGSRRKRNNLPERTVSSEEIDHERTVPPLLMWPG